MQYMHNCTERGPNNVKREVSEKDQGQWVQANIVYVDDCRVALTLMAGREKWPKSAYVASVPVSASHLSVCCIHTT